VKLVAVPMAVLTAVGRKAFEVLKVKLLKVGALDEVVSTLLI
jgi:hypothetical protein